jgi:hypothetical protein
MPVNVDVPSQRRSVGVQRCVKRIAPGLRRIVMFVRRQFVTVILPMLVLSKVRLIAMLVTTVLKGKSNIEAMRFRWLP